MAQERQITREAALTRIRAAIAKKREWLDRAEGELEQLYASRHKLKLQK